MEILTPEISGRLILPWEPLKVATLGDIQTIGTSTKGLGPDLADLKRLRRHVEWGTEEGVTWFGSGDYIDFLSPSNRRALRASGIYDTAEAAIDRLATEIEDELFDILRPTIGNWAVLVEGHHWYQHLDGTTTGQRLAKFVGCAYGGDGVFMRLTFRDHSGKATTTNLVLTHGSGGINSAGAAFNKYEKAASAWDAQVIIVGHHHQVGIHKFPIMKLNSSGIPHMYHENRAIVLAGSFMRGYLEGSEMGGRPAGSYVEQAFLKPVSLGAPVLTMTPKTVSLGDGATVNLVDLRGSV